MPQDHPLRAIRKMVDAALQELLPQFDSVYAQMGRPSIPPEQLLRAQLSQMFYRFPRIFCRTTGYEAPEGSGSMKYQSPQYGV